MTKKMIVANWKMLPNSLAEAEGILEFVDQNLEGLMVENPLFSIVFCPPFIFLEDVGRIIKNSNLSKIASLGAQDISSGEGGAWTGEVSGPMLRRLGVEYVIVGHSERRLKLGESNALVDQKIKVALDNQIEPIVCLGETTRNDGYKDFLIDQITRTFEGLTADEIGKCILCYEPVWAISTNLNAHPDTPESAVESIRFIKQFLFENLFLYGGSVNSTNVASFLSQEEINGVLVGAASVNKGEFVKILQRVAQL